MAGTTRKYQESVLTNEENKIVLEKRNKLKTLKDTQRHCLTIKPYHQTALININDDTKPEIPQSEILTI